MKMPDTLQDLYEALYDITQLPGKDLLLMEQVGKHRLGNSAQSSATFAKHVGHLEMAMIALKIPVITVTPTVWMKEVVPGRPKGVDPSQVRARKNYIKDKMQRRFPDQKVTLAKADAYAMLAYLMKHQGEY
jgi:hypothetical protein